MIIVFHYVFFIARLFTKYVMKSYHQNSVSKGINSLADSTEQKVIVDSDVIYDDMGIRFIPPVYVQRYMAVCKILEDDRWTGTLRKVIDFGCAELGFFQYVKNVAGVQEILAVDIDEELLRYYKCRASPLTSDYLKKRHEPLTVHVLAGSIAEQDSCLQGTDAVICIELIEHLYPDTLEALPYTVFEYVQPKVAIFTTPNSEFNVLLPNFSGFRHDDHKFEWTREQFTCWAQNLTVRFPRYTVSFVGVAPGPEGASQFGCCSQMAVFVQDGPDTVEGVRNVDSDIEHKGVYKLLDTYTYPFEVETRTVEEIIRDEATYYISSYGSSHMYDMEDDNAHIPLGLLMPSVRKWCDSIDKLREVLEDSCWRVVESCGQPCVVYPHKRWSNWLDDQEDEGNCSNAEDEADESVAREQQAADPSLRATGEQDDWGSVEPWADADQWCPRVLGDGKEKGGERDAVAYGPERFDGSAPTNDAHDGKVCGGEVLQSPVLATADRTMLQGGEDYLVRQLDVSSLEEKYSCVPKTRTAEDGTSCTLSQGDISSDGNQVELLHVGNSDQNCVNLLLENCDVCDKGCESTVEVLTCKQTIDEDVCGDVGRPAESCEPVTQTCDVIRTVVSHSSCGSGKNSSVKRSELLDRECGSPALVDACSQNKRSSRNLEAALEETSNVDSCSLEEQNDKAADSGYPNSTDMDLDPTPEQVDEISTENDALLTGNSSFDEDSEYEASLSGSEDEPVRPALHRPGDVLRDVPGEGMENGDVANNNQDEEGNNAEARGDAAAMDLAAMLDLENENNLADVDPFPNWLLHLLGVADVRGAGPSSEDEDDSSSSSSVSMHGPVEACGTVSPPGASRDITA